MTDESNMDAMEQGEPVETQARDRMVHGLLVTRHELPIDRQRRIQGLMQRVQRESLRNAPWRRVVRHLGGLAAVAAVLVASIRLHALDTLLHTSYQGPAVMTCDAAFHKGEELGWFQHGSTILLFVPASFSIAPHIHEGKILKMGESLINLPSDENTV